MILKRTIVIYLLILCVTGLSAQRHASFNPKQFDAEMEQFITSEAGLTPKEAASFFPLFEEMQQKQRVLFDKMRLYRHVNTQDDQACMEAIKKMDETDLEIKELRQKYHLKFCKVLPAGKVMSVIKADEKFHRMFFKRTMKRNQH